jgi:hypothetical protein
MESDYGAIMKLLKRRATKSFSFGPELIARLDLEVPRKQSRWVETELLKALDRQGKQVPEQDSQ